MSIGNEMSIQNILDWKMSIWNEARAQKSNRGPGQRTDKNMFGNRWHPDRQAWKISM